MSLSSSTRLVFVAALALGLPACSSDNKVSRDADASQRDDASASDASADASAIDSAAASDASDESSDAQGNDGALDASPDDAAIDAGEAGAAVDAGDAAAKPEGATQKAAVFVAVGYAGRRIRSTDLGLTWTDDQSLGGGGDDTNLLRAVAFGDGMFVAVGWKIFSSPDGRLQNWTERTMEGQQWLGGIAHGNHRFVATGGYGTSAWSSDGLIWQAGGSLDTEASRSLAFGANSFVSATDDGHWWSSVDARSWLLLSADHTSSQIAYCSNEFRDAAECLGAFTSRTTASGEGVTVRVRNGQLERSSNGTAFTTVLSGGSPLESVAFGYARR